MGGSDYVWDVFLSYRRIDPVDTWVRDLFQRDLSDWLGDELGRNSRVFFDQDVLETGDSWPDELRQALRTSRVLLAVLSPRYWISKWCQIEWESFKMREEVLRRAGLRIPIIHNDGKHIPSEAKIIQHFNFSDYATKYT